MPGSIPDCPKTGRPRLQAAARAKLREKEETDMMTMKIFDGILWDLDEIIYGADCSVIASDR